MVIGALSASGYARAISAAAASPARRISVRDGVPAAIAAASLAAASAAVVTRTSVIRRRRRACSFVRLCDCAAEADLAVVDADVEAALGIAANPRLVHDRRPIAPVVAQRQHRTLLTFPAVRKRIVLHAATPPHHDKTNCSTAEAQRLR